MTKILASGEVLATDGAQLGFSRMAPSLES